MICFRPTSLAQTTRPAFSGTRFRLQPEVQAAAGLTVDHKFGDGMRIFATPSVTHRS